MYVDFIRMRKYTLTKKMLNLFPFVYHQDRSLISQSIYNILEVLHILPPLLDASALDRNIMAANGEPMMPSILCIYCSATARMRRG